MVCDDVCVFHALTSYLVIDFILGQRFGRNSIPTPFAQNHWTLGKGFLTGGGLDMRTVSPRTWSWNQTCQSTRGFWMMFLVIWFNLK